MRLASAVRLASGPLVLGLLLVASPCLAGEPISLFGGHLGLAGEVSGAYGTEDKGYFNNTGYGDNTLRLFRLDLTAELHAGAHLSALADLRSDNLGHPRSYALYLRLRPFRDRAFDVQAGQIPTVFGAFPRRRYLQENPLIGTPVVYQYLTSLRYDAVPRNANELALRRGLGWRVPYPSAPTPTAPGLPVVNGERWDTGVQVRLGSEPVQVALSVTQGSLCHPLFHDDNDGKQLSGRFAWKPSPAFTLGLSGAYGAYLSRTVTDTLPAGLPRSYEQQVAGLDVEWSYGYWIVRGEAVWSAFDMPVLGKPEIDSPVKALGLMLEARFKIAPGLYVAARFDNLHFSDIETTTRGVLPWEAPVVRVETGVGYSLRRDVLLKAVYQYDHRDGGFTQHKANLVAAQALFWF
jgi:hypothetical protein